MLTSNNVQKIWLFRNNIYLRKEPSNKWPFVHEVFLDPANHHFRYVLEYVGVYIIQFNDWKYAFLCCSLIILILVSYLSPYYSYYKLEAVMDGLNRVP